MKRTIYMSSRAARSRLIAACLSMVLSMALGTALVLATAGKAAADDKQTTSDRFYFRAGAIHLRPFVDSGEVVLSDVTGAASLAVKDGPVPGSGGSVDSITAPAGIVGYVLPYLNRQLAIETLVGVPVTITLRATGTLAEMSLAPEALGIQTGIEALGPQMGTAKALPPMVTLVYRMLPGARVHPYVGAGMSLFIAYDGKITNPVLTEVVEPELEIPPVIAPVLQGGLEARLFGRFFATLDLKFMPFLTTEAKVKGMYMNLPTLPIYETVRVGTASMNVTVNPLLVHLGVGANF